MWIDLPKTWDSSEDWTRITRISMRIGEKTRFARFWLSASKIGFFFCQGQISAQGILHLRNPNLGPNSAKRILDARIFLARILGSNFFGPIFSRKRGHLKNSPSRNSPPKIHLPKPREARDLISKIRSWTVRSDLKNKAFSAVFCLFLRSDLTVQDRILEIRSLASLGIQPRNRAKKFTWHLCRATWLIFCESIRANLGTLTTHTPQIWEVKSAPPWIWGVDRQKTLVLLGPAFGRMDFSRIFIFEPPDFFADFLAGFFSFLWEKVPRKILQENPRENPPKFIQQKSSNTFLQIAQGKFYSTFEYPPLKFGGWKRHLPNLGGMGANLGNVGMRIACPLSV